MRSNLIACGWVFLAAAARLFADTPSPDAPPFVKVATLVASTNAHDVLKQPAGVAVDPATGVVYVTDSMHHRVVAIGADGNVLATFGTGKPGLTDGSGTAAQFKEPRGAAFDPVRRALYVADAGNHVIRRITPGGNVETLAGSGRPGSRDGSRADASFKAPAGVAVDPAGNVYVADTGNGAIRKVSADGVVTTLAGGTVEGFADGPAAEALFNRPEGVAIGTDGSIYVADSANHAVRRYASGNVTTVAGTRHGGYADGPALLAELHFPSGVAVADSGDLYVADRMNHAIRRVTLGDHPVVSTVSGTGRNGHLDGSPAQAEFHEPLAVAAAGAVYVADSKNDALRIVYPGLALTAVEPPQGAPQGGTEVVVRGAGFIPGAAQVAFDGSAGTDVSYVSSLELRLKTPPHAIGLVDVAVTTPAGMATLEDGFEYQPPYVQLLITPPAATLSRGDRLALRVDGVTSGGTATDVTEQVSWSSSHPARITVDATGVLRALDVGSATLTASLGSLSVSATILVREPFTQLQVVPASATLQTGDTVPLRVNGTGFDGGVTDVTARVAWTTSDGEIAGVSTGGLATAHAVGTATITATLDTLSATALITVRPPVPPDPALIAPPLDPTVGTNIYDATRFLYEGPDAIQTGMTGTIEPVRVSVLRGRVLLRDGVPLSGARVTVADHPELGETLTRLDGGFDLVVNGGGSVVIRFEKAGHLPSERSIPTSWQHYAIVDDVVLLPLDEHSSPIVMAASFAQVARGTRVSDEDGQRQSTLIVPAGTTAMLVMPDGQQTAVSSLVLRATEYTVGAAGVAAMPADLPAQTGYTYCVELSADEAIAAGAETVVFNQPVFHYVENFLGFPVGGIVPTGYYDRRKHAWIAAPNGRVIRIVAVTGGAAQIDANGDGSADDGAALAALGVTPAEQQQLAELYVSGQTLWRVPVPHLTPWDHNWPFGPPADAVAPSNPNPSVAPNLPDSQCQFGSVIECENLTLGESFPIVGTPYTLNYRSDRVAGRTGAYKMTVTLSGASIPPSLRRVELRVEVAGRSFKRSFAPATNLQHTFIWDGKDAYRRTAQGPQPVDVVVGYAYPALYQEPANFAASFGMFSGVPLTANEARREFVAEQRMQRVVELGLWDQKELGLGGWSIDAHHTYLRSTQVVMRGDGRVQNAEGTTDEARLRAGGGEGLFVDGVPATEVALNGVSSMAFAPDGTLYILHGQQLSKVDPQGLYWRVANASGVAGFTGDGGPAYFAQINPGNGQIALGPDGSIYLADRGNGRVRRIDPSGRITTFAGIGATGSRIDGVRATQSRILPAGLAVAADGSVYIGDLRFLRRVSPDGIIATVAGTGSVPGSSQPAGTVARQTPIFFPDSLHVERSGALLIVDGQRLLRLRPDGRIYTVAGRFVQSGGGQTSGDGGKAIDARFTFLNAAVALPDGSIVVSQDNYVRRIDASGIIQRIAGNPAATAITGTPLNTLLQRPHVALDPAGEIVLGLEIFTSLNAPGVVMTLRSGLQPHAFEVPDSAGYVHHFDDRGRHVVTLDADTRRVEREFDYDAGGRVAGIRDRNGGRTAIERFGSTVRITSPRGRVTVLQLNADGYLEKATTPAGRAFEFEYDGHGRMLAAVSPEQRRTSFTYDGDGLLAAHQSARGLHRTLERSVDATGAEVKVRTGGGRLWRYLRRRSGTDTEKTSIDPAGKSTTAVVNGDGGSESATLPDGTSVTAIAASADQRYGMTLPIFNSSVRLPSGLKLTAAGARSLEFEDGTPFSALMRRVDSLTVNGRTVTQVHDLAAKTLTWTTPAGRTVTARLDDRGQVVESASPGLAPVSYEYDAGGLLHRMTQGTRSTTFTTDASLLVTMVEDHLGRQTGLVRDADGLLDSMRLPGGRSVAFTHDAEGNVLSVTPPGRSAHRFEYATNGNLSSYAPPDGAPTTFRFTTEGELSAVLRPDGKNLAFTYDDQGRPRSVSTPQGAYTVEYAESGHVAAANAPDRGRLEYSYDGGVVRATTWSGAVSGAVSVAMDSDLRIQSESVNGGSTIAFGYDADDLLTAAGALELRRGADSGMLMGTSLGAFTDSWVYNEYGERTGYAAEVAGVPLLDVTYTRSPGGEISGITETFENGTATRTFEYDDAGRLWHVAVNGTPVAEYVYDANGNRLSLQRTGRGVENGTYDPQDRLLTYGDATYTYTAGGDLATATIGGETTTYEYDAFGSLRNVVMTGLTVEYVIDAQHRRVGKKRNGTLEQGFLYAGGLRIVAELNGEGRVVSRFVYGTRPHVPDYMIRAGVTYRIVSDHVGSPRLVVDAATGQIAQRLEYDEFGAVLLDTNPGFQPFGFAGGLYDRDTGFVRFGARDYDGRVGRWTSKDPIGFAGRDTNLYAYVLNDPVNLVDPLGTDWMEAMEPVADFAAGIGDTLSFGLTTRFNDWTGASSVVDKCSDAFAAGELTGTSVSLAFGASHLGRNALKQGLRRLAYDNRTWGAVRSAWSGRPGTLRNTGRSLHHWLIPQRADAPRGIVNAGFNYMPISAGLNSYMNGSTATRVATEWGFRGTVAGIYGGAFGGGSGSGGCRCQ